MQVTKNYLEKNYANIITLLRIIGITLIFFLFPFTTSSELWFVFFIFLLVSLSDFLDGYIARKFKIVSEIGILLDPLADKICLLLLLIFVANNNIAPWAVFILLSRELCVLSLRVHASSKNIKNLASKSLGKIKTTVSFILIGLLFLKTPVNESSLPSFFIPLENLRKFIYSMPNEFILIFVALAIFLSLISLKTYLKDYLPQNHE